ncbi:nucleotidyltransferase family protein [Agrobacterium larrymoorei]|uniref:Nucleotidyltransferase domain-containing protein n=1 Tax=Agrobacterium larrymoorei TaxID=160699 RepID=A0AAF0H9J9_9HYPH|nr:nucleotidyltransferase domain-containing protein [Agrobacterium larrymoorei]WHA40308.1 nucleotidyltransferase domain-containing protein [Agrobacterium larrymoorei]
MEKRTAIEKLKARADAVKSMGATSLFLFGSTARDEANVRSDLDLFIDYDPEVRFSLIDLISIKQFLEEELDVEVDLTTRTSLHPQLRNAIELSAVRVF